MDINQNEIDKRKTEIESLMQKVQQSSQQHQLLVQHAQKRITFLDGEVSILTELVGKSTEPVAETIKQDV